MQSGRFLRRREKAMKRKMKLRKVLTKREIRQLSRIHTTKKEARQIRRRNVSLLQRLYAFFMERGSKYATKSWIGCPHCQRYDCGSCGSGGEYLDDECPWGGACCDQTFGGYSLDNQEYVEYTPNSEKIIDMPLRVGEFRRSERFLLGHIEWADRILSGKIKVRRGRRPAR